MKKTALTLLTAALLLAATPASSAFAHHAGNGHRGQQYPTCTVQNCTQSGVHSHGDNIYCTLENCVNNGTHQYDAARCQTYSGSERSACAHSGSYKQHCR